MRRDEKRSEETSMEEKREKISLSTQFYLRTDAAQKTYVPDKSGTFNIQVTEQSIIQPFTLHTGTS